MRESIGQEMEEALGAVEAEFSTVNPTESAGELTEIEKELPTIYTIRDAVIAKMADKFLPMKIEGVEDKKGYAAVHSARMIVKEARIQTEKARKDANDEHQFKIKKYNAEAKRLFGLMEPIEAHLEAEEKRVDDEISRIKAEKQRELDARLQARIDALQKVGAPFQVSELVMMTEGAFQAILTPATEAWNLKEAARLDAEAKAKAYEQQQAEEAARKEAEAKAERERLAKEEADRITKVKAEQAAEAERQAKVKAEQDKQAAELKAEREAIEAAKAKLAQEARDKQIREEAEAKTKVDAEQKAKAEIARKEQEAKATAEREAKAKAEAEARGAAIEAAKPDAQKLRNLAVLVAAMKIPSMATETGQAVEKEIRTALFRFAEFIKAKAEALTNG